MKLKIGIPFNKISLTIYRASDARCGVPGLCYD